MQAAGAGRRNRTDITCLEGRGFTIKLYPPAPRGLDRRTRRVNAEAMAPGGRSRLGRSEGRRVCHLSAAIDAPAMSPLPLRAGRLLARVPPGSAARHRASAPARRRVPVTAGTHPPSAPRAPMTSPHRRPTAAAPKCSCLDRPSPAGPRARQSSTGSINSGPSARFEFTRRLTRWASSVPPGGGTISRAAPSPASPSQSGQSPGSRTTGIR